MIDVCFYNTIVKTFKSASYGCSSNSVSSPGYISTPCPMSLAKFLIKKMSVIVNCS